MEHQFQAAGNRVIRQEALRGVEIGCCRALPTLAVEVQLQASRAEGILDAAAPLLIRRGREHDSVPRRDRDPPEAFDGLNRLAEGLVIERTIGGSTTTRYLLRPVACSSRIHLSADIDPAMARTNALDDEIRSRIEMFVQELSSLVKVAALEAVHSALGEAVDDAPVRRGPGRPRGSPGRTATSGGEPDGRRDGRIRRSGDDLEAMTEQILDHVRSNPGRGSEQISAAIGLSTKEMRLPIQKLIADGKLRTEGQRRGTRYFAGARGAAGVGNGRKAKGQRAAQGGRKGARQNGREPAGTAAESSTATAA